MMDKPPQNNMSLEQVISLNDDLRSVYTDFESNDNTKVIGAFKKFVKVIEQMSTQNLKEIFGNELKKSMEKNTENIEGITLTTQVIKIIEKIQAEVISMSPLIGGLKEKIKQIELDNMITSSINSTSDLDDSFPPEVREVIKQQAAQIGTGLYIINQFLKQ